MTTDAAPFARLTGKLFPGSTLLRAWPLIGGISAETTALEIAGPDGAPRRLIVRRPGEAALRHNPRAAEDEFKVLQILQAEGLSTPQPYALDASGEVFPTPYLVMAYVDGQPDFAPGDPVDDAIQMAEQLARIHAIRGARADLAFLPRASEQVEIFRAPAPVNDALEEGRIRAALAAAAPFPRHNPPALLHGDYWPGNLLWRAGRLAAVIDWEDAAVGDPLADLAISRLDLLWIYGRGAMDAFTRRYFAQSGADRRSLPYWDLHAALRLARLAGDDLSAWAAFFHPYGRTDITAQSILAHERFFVAQALEALDRFAQAGSKRKMM